MREATGDRSWSSGKGTSAAGAFRGGLEAGVGIEPEGALMGKRRRLGPTKKFALPPPWPPLCVAWQPNTPLTAARSARLETKTSAISANWKNPVKYICRSPQFVVDGLRERVQATQRSQLRTRRGARGASQQAVPQSRNPRILSSPPSPSPAQGCSRPKAEVAAFGERTPVRRPASRPTRIRRKPIAMMRSYNSDLLRSCRLQPRSIPSPLVASRMAPDAIG